jgi:hypothetical protein
MRDERQGDLLLINAHLNPLPEAVNDHDAAVWHHSVVDDNLRHGRVGPAVSRGSFAASF